MEKKEKRYRGEEKMIETDNNEKEEGKEPQQDSKIKRAMKAAVPVVADMGKEIFMFAVTTAVGIVVANKLGDSSGTGDGNSKLFGE